MVSVLLVEIPLQVSLQNTMVQWYTTNWLQLRENTSLIGSYIIIMFMFCVAAIVLSRLHHTGVHDH